jgi:hypothetical protein
MRKGVGAEFPHRGHQARDQQREPVRAPAEASAQVRANIARFFFDLRRVLRLSPHQVSAHLLTRTETIDALESGLIEYLPPWPETARIVMAYAAMAGIDGRPVLAAIAGQIQIAAGIAPEPASRGLPPQRRQPPNQLRRAGLVIANSAKRLPQQVRERPERAFYAVSLPLGLLLFALNTSLLSHVAAPVVSLTHKVSQVFHVYFAPVRDGHRWIEVDEPKSRRADKLRTAER